MTAKEFVANFKKENDSLVQEYLKIDSQSEVKNLIDSLNLNEEQLNKMKLILKGALRDISYTILLSLDGSASIGDSQELYDLKDLKGNQISGEIEEYAYEFFQTTDS